jgi:hypothetical protein
MFVLFSAIIPHMNIYPAIWPLRYVLRIGLQIPGATHPAYFSLFHRPYSGKLLKKLSAFQRHHNFRDDSHETPQLAPQKPIVSYKRNNQDRTKATLKALLFERNIQTVGIEDWGLPIRLR